jgi:hypothetical protein
LIMDCWKTVCPFCGTHILGPFKGFWRERITAEKSIAIHLGGCERAPFMKKRERQREADAAVEYVEVA